MQSINSGFFVTVLSVPFKLIWDEIETKLSNKLTKKVMKITLLAENLTFSLKDAMATTWEGCEVAGGRFSIQT